MNTPTDNKEPSSVGSETKAGRCFSDFCSTVDFTSIKNRVLQIIKDPEGCWTPIREEPADVKGLFQKYIMVLAAIGPVLMLVRGIGAPIASLIAAILSYAVSLAMVYLSALIVQKLSPKFSGSVDMTGAVKLIGYSMTPSFLTGISILFTPVISFLVSLFGLYSIYVFFKGITPMTGVPSEKRIPFCVAVVACSFVLTILLGMIVASITIGAAASSGAIRPLGGV